jgi:ectoine hydroxylase-related dioxygenase (phytanoyl-CoA dioxygenase family)
MAGAVHRAALDFSAAERDAYARDGYVVRTSVWDRDELEALRDLVEAVIGGVAAHAGRPGAGPQFTMADGHRMQFSSGTVIQWEWAEGSRAVRLIEPFTHLHPRFAALWEDARLTAPMRDALGVDAVAPYTCKLNLKRAREGSQFPWHQDYTYWYAFTPATAHEIATAILFLDDAGADNGALRVLAGSHRRGPAARDPADPTRFLADPARLDLSAERAVAVPAGSLLMFPALMVHRSSPNTSARQRRAILLSFQPGGRPRQRELEWHPERVEDLP